MCHKGYGYVPDFGDPRDHLYAAAVVPLPTSVDLRGKMPPIWDQGSLGSCTAFALCGAVGFLHGFDGSKLWLYYEERSAENSVNSDSGAQIRDGIKVLAKKGLPAEGEWPYKPALFDHRPPVAVTREAKTNLISSYNRLVSLADYRNCLAAGFPFVVGISVFESFESNAVAKTGIVPMPAKSEQAIGGHAVCVVGYDAGGRFIVRNSWGTDWGQDGYFTLPAEYLASADLATDAWKIAA